MDTDLEITILTALSAVMFFGGTALVLFAGPTLTTVGFLLVILSVIVLLVDMRDIIGHWGQIAGD